MTNIISRLSGQALRLIGIALAAYISIVFVYAYYHYSTINARLLTYGISSSSADMISFLVMLSAFFLPAFSAIRIFTFRGKPIDFVAATFFPLLAWGITLIPANFDVTSGQALRYCSERPDGELFCLDHAGVDPITQQPLRAMDSKLASREYLRAKDMLPDPLEGPLDSVEFFDGLSGAPKVWIERTEDGCYALYDGPGFSPKTGVALVAITKERIKAIRSCRKEKRQDGGQRSDRTSYVPDSSDTDVSSRGYPDLMNAEGSNNSVVSAKKYAAPFVLTGTKWIVTSTDSHGNSWNGSTLMFTSQESRRDGQYAVKGHFDWRSNRGHSGRELVQGTLSEDNRIELIGYAMVRSNGITLARYRADLATDGNTIVGNWDTDGMQVYALPGSFKASRSF